MSRLTAGAPAWILILGIALGVRLAGGAWWQSRLPPGAQFYFPDSASYWELGKAIANGQPYQYLSSDARVLRTPGYPLLLAGLFRAFGDDPPVMAARALSALFGSLAVAIVGWWTTRLFDARAGVIAGWIAALYPGAVAMSAFVLSEAPFCVFMLLELALWGAAWRATARRSMLPLAAAAGAVGAVATLIRPSWLLFTPLALVIGLVFDRAHRGRQAVMGLAIAATFVLCMLPWWIRNAQVTGHFVPTTLAVGASLYDGLNPHADGSSDMRFVAGFIAQENAAVPLDADLADTFEYRLDRRMFDEALAWARENPASVARLTAVKLGRLWNVWPNESSLRSWPMRLVVLVSFAPLAALSLLGIWRFTARGWPYVLVWLPAVYFTLLHVVFVSSIRYREPAMLAAIVLAAGVLAGAARSPAPIAPPLPRV